MAGLCRGWGYEEIIFPASFDLESSKFDITIIIEGLGTGNEIKQYFRSIVEEIELPLVYEEEVFIPAGVNPFQSPVFLVGLGLPYFVEFYPNGHDSRDKISLVIFHKLHKFYVIHCEISIKLWNEEQRMTYKRSLKTKSYTAQFSNVCPINLNQDWNVKIKFKIFRIEPVRRTA